ncbi:hypothetical protein MLD38_014861 [Melastoma candidum]|uniref:Uncharacterized protein n=1 Tax=Melastoma candidum TaxID=119954 RepID=A0ACB9RE14_9MYRT|nr:hypothetical protein MLD38_014861 [Melastoma candidum]
MLAEALFEVLDELHRQPIFPPLSPSPKKSAADNEENDEQCYICLVEYAEGDQIRVLPCKHEYHMHCVDKWLKEIHGICPLCRGDVCDGSTEHNTASDPEISAA